MGVPLVAHATAPDGEPYLVLGGPCGDIMRWVPETGPLTYLTTDIGNIGLLGWATNRIFYGGRWLIRLCPDTTRRHPGNPPSLAEWTVTKRQAFDLTELVARHVKNDGVAAARAWMDAQLAVAAKGRTKS